MRIHTIALLSASRATSGQSSACILALADAKIARTIIRRKLAAGQTQQQVADDLAWGRGDVSHYASLQNIDDKAWRVIATTMSNSTLLPAIDAVAEKDTAGAFSERLLRDILALSAPQQLAAVTAPEARPSP